MEYDGYFTREELFLMVEQNFPIILKPERRNLFCAEEGDVMRSIISKSISGSRDQQMSSDLVLVLYDEFGSLSSLAIQWFFPVFLRELLHQGSHSEIFSDSLVGYLEHADYVNENSAYNFGWLNDEQIRVVFRLLEYVSEEYKLTVSIAEENLLKYGGK